MKFRAFLLMALAVSLTMASCTKNYTCYCGITYSGTPGLPDSTTQTYTIKDTQSNAKSKCQKESGTYNNNSITTVENCYLY